MAPCREYVAPCHWTRRGHWRGSHGASHDAATRPKRGRGGGRRSLRCGADFGPTTCWSANPPTLHATQNGRIIQKQKQRQDHAMLTPLMPSRRRPARTRFGVRPRFGPGRMMLGSTSGPRPREGSGRNSTRSPRRSAAPRPAPGGEGRGHRRTTRRTLGGVGASPQEMEGRGGGAVRAMSL